MEKKKVVLDYYNSIVRDDLLNRYNINDPRKVEKYEELTIRIKFKNVEESKLSNEIQKGLLVLEGLVGKKIVVKREKSVYKGSGFLENIEMYVNVRGEYIYQVLEYIIEVVWPLSKGRHINIELRKSDRGDIEIYCEELGGFVELERQTGELKERISIRVKVNKGKIGGEIGIWESIISKIKEERK